MIYFDIEVFYELIWKILLKRREKLGFIAFIRKSLATFDEHDKKTLFDDFVQDEKQIIQDSYLQHAWVSVAVDLIARNIARAKYSLFVDKERETKSRAAKLFANPNKEMSCLELWKQTAAWWSLEGEAFWYFGNEYVSGIPKTIQILNPRLINHQVTDGVITKYQFMGDEGMKPCWILPDEVVHFKNWNPWNKYRGVSPLASLAMELEQDILAGKSNSDLLKDGGIPKGLLKTDQIIREEEAEELERRWEAKYGKGTKRRVAVIGKGTTYQQLTLSPDVLKVFDIKKWNLYTILAKYGIPPRVANIQDSKSSLSGTDTKAQHEAFWLYTLLPLLQEFEEIVNLQFFVRLGLKERGHFETSHIAELQESQELRSQRAISEVKAGLKTINEIRKSKNEVELPWGNVWWKSNSCEPVGGEQK